VTSTGAWIAVIGVALIAAAAGCGDECSEGEVRCMDNTVQSCSGVETENGWDSTLRWRVVQTCLNSTCFAPPGRQPMCVLSTDPDPLCAGAQSHCSGDDIVTCAGGYAGVTSTCAASAGDPAFSRCVAADPSHAGCVPRDALPSDACAAAAMDASLGATVCADDVIISCFAGLATVTVACRSCDLGQYPACSGFIGDGCNADGQCAAGFTCHADSTGTLRCAAACDAASPNAAQACLDLFLAGGPRSRAGQWLVPLPAGQMTCTAGFCEWVH
jgi:hypothetical protein